MSDSVATAGEPILRVEGLKVHFPIESGLVFKKVTGHVRAVDGISFELMPGETLGLVGESGCGKSTTARAIIGLVRPTAGEVWFKERNLAGLAPAEMRAARVDLQMIFQDPYACLSPRMTVTQIVGEPLRNFTGLSRSEREHKVCELLSVVGLSPSWRNRYPHEFSGGQRQRIGVARALAVNPDLILCDEPVSALDVSIQAQVVNLLEDLQRQFNLTYVFIAHDLSVVRHISDRVAVMYLGRIVELADRDTLYHNPLHPYTRALLSAVPIPDPRVQTQRHRIVLEGDVPSPTKEYPGCRFADRCPLAEERCRTEDPEFREVEAPNGTAHRVACHLVEGAPPALRGGERMPTSG